MFHLKRWREYVKTGRRKGVSIVESLIILVVLGISLWAIMTTIAWSTDLQTFSRQHIDMQILATSWFEIFESVNPEPFDDDFTMATASNRVALFLDTGSVRTWPNYVIHGYRVNVSGDESGMAPNGVRTVTLRLESAGGARSKKPVIVSRKINARSSETVSDDRWGGI